ncbi:MAG: hypothetical protein ACRBN8_19920 [Nannocystales bacterium]
MAAETLSPEDRASALVTFGDTPGPKGLSPRDSWEGRVSRFEALANAGAPRRELAAAWAYDLESCDALDAAIGWAKEQRTGMLILSSSVGLGKTTAAARYALTTTAAWCHAPLLALDEWASAAKRVQSMLEAQHLVIDEIGGPGTTSGMAVARISAILSARHAAERPTVVTTNLPESRFAQVYDGVKPDESRLVDRVNDGGSWVSCKRAREQGSYRVSGGCDYTKNRYEDASRALKLLRATESGDIRSFVLKSLQESLGCKDEDLIRIRDEAPGRREQVDGMLQRFLDKIRVNDPRKTARDEDAEDGRRRAHLQAQARGVTT